MNAFRIVNESAAGTPPTMGVGAVQESTGYRIGKRAMDLTGAMIGILFLLPLLLMVIIMIKLEDPKGPVLFKQTRVGKNGRHFAMFKFRSMVTNAEQILEELKQHNEIEGAMFKMKNDPRVTKIGRFIRKTSIDELPQLWNVLRGDMSLVGPRPPLVREVAEYTAYDMQRLQVVPGCTGLWQVGGRNSLSFYEMVELDLKYIEERSLLLDIKIIIKTFAVMFGSRDAF
jgi:exopolysaccharide biosynthesis polyprenyl glycosylphosphotransferase